MRLLLSVVATGLLLIRSNLSAQNPSSIQLAWDASPSSNVTSYVVHYGAASGVYSYSTNVGNQTTTTVTGLQTGQVYYLVVTARDDLGVESLPSNEVNYQVPETLLPPTIALTSPVSGISYLSPATVTLTAAVVSNGQTINKVQFYSGTTLLSEDASAPYDFSWNNVTAGSYALTARAVYATSNTVTSASVNVTVMNPPPTIALTSPIAGTSYTSPASVVLAASVVANGQTINKVQFYNGSTLLGEDATAPYSFTWNNVASGSYALSARAVYATSNTVISAAVNVTVTNPPPTITLTSPIAGAGYTSPATITLDASLTANGHSISKVQFYNGTTLLGEDTSAPYSLTWSNVTSGNYSLSAQAIYGTGNVAVSPAVNVAVSGLPAPWQTLDLGATGLSGSVSHSNGVFTTTGTGRIGGTADSFRFVYQTLSTDGEIRARLDQVSIDGANGNTGLMMRESLTPGSRFAHIGIAQDLGFRWQHRTKTGKGMSSTTSGTATPSAVWVRLVRTRNSVTAYKSTNGTTWTLVGNVSISMAREIHFGFVVASGNTTTLNTSVFSEVQAVP